MTVLRRTLPVGPLQCNCSILVDEATRDALIVDPGDEADAILFSVGGMGGLPAHGDSFAYQDGYAESEAEPYWATWSLV